MEIGSAEWQQLIIDGAQSFEIDVDLNMTVQFAVHASELMTWNRKVNLTAITEPRDVAIKHFLDSIIPGLLIAPGATVLDIGSGGGFPGIPLKILKPSLFVILIDSSRKKVSFAKHVIRTLKLKNIEARNVRAEEFANNQDPVKRFDVIISRALTSIENLISIASPLLAKDGVIIAMKGADPLQEMNVAYELVDKNNALMEIDQVEYKLALKKYLLPYLKTQRYIISIKSGG